MSQLFKRPISLILTPLFVGFPICPILPKQSLEASELSINVAAGPRWNGANRAIRYQYGDRAQLTAATNGAQFTYDEVGRVATRTVDGKQQILEWNAQGRLTKIQYADGTETTYQYDPLGRLIRRTNRQKETSRYVYDGLKLIQERRENGPVLASYIYAEGLDEPVLMTANGRIYLFIYDRLGSVVAIADTAEKSSQAVVARYRYDAWGNLLEETAKIQQPFRFAGYVWESDAELYYLGNRWYDPAVGRFISPDPILPVSLTPQDWNTYVYASNDPVNRVDAMGLQSELALSQGYSPWDALGKHLTQLPQTLVQRYRQRPKGVPESIEATWLGLPQKGAASWTEALSSSNPEAANIMFHPLLGSLPEAAPSITTNPLSITGFGELPRQMSSGLVYASQLALPEIYGSVWYDSFLKPHLATQNSGILSSGMMPSANNQVESLFGFTDHLTAIPDVYAQKVFQRPGAISLNRSTKALSQLTDLRGAVWDSTRRQLIITGKKGLGPSLHLNDLFVAIDTLYSGKEIGVSIDPVPPKADGQLPDYMTVRYIPEQIRGTNIGHVVFEADRWLKVLSMGRDNVTSEAPPKIKGYQSRLDRMRLDDTQNEQRVWNRFWFEPDILSLKTAPKAFKYDRASLKVQTEYFDPGPPPASINGRDPSAQEFVNHLNQNYKSYSNQVPIFRELEQVTQMVTISKWLRHESIYPDLAWLSSRPKTSVRNTPATTPARTLQSDNIFERDGKWYQLGIYGGVSLAPEPTLTPEPTVAQYKEDVLSSRPSDDAVSWQVPTGETAVAVSLATAPESGGIRWSVTDLEFRNGQGLARYTDSLNSGATGPFGSGWSALPSELEFPKPYQKVKDKNTSQQTEIVFHDRVTGTSTKFELVRGNDGSLQYQSSEGTTGLQLEQQKNGYSVRIGAEKHNFDSLGRLQTRTLADGTEETYVWKDFGKDKRLSQIRYSDDLAITLNYDASGFRITDAKDNTGRTAYYKYDDLGRLQSVRDTQDVSRETYKYNEDGMLTLVLGGGDEVKFQAQYDGKGRVKSLMLQDWKFIYQPNGAVQIQRNKEIVGTVRYSASGQVASTETPEGTSWTVEQKDSMTAQIKTADPTIALTIKTNSQGQIEDISHPQLGSLTKVARTASGHPLSVTNQSGATTNLEYDEQNRLHRITNGYEGHAIEFTYDAEGHLTALKDPDGFLVHLNNAGKPWTNSVQIGNNAAIAIKRNEIGQPIEMVNASGEKTRLAWDEQGRLVELKTPFSNYQLTADSKKSVTLLDGEGRRLSYTFDQYGRLQGIRDSQGSTIQLKRDSMSHLEQFVGPDGTSINLNWDRRDRITEIKDNRQGRQTKIKRDVMGRITHIESGREQLQLEYDALGRLQRLRQNSASDVEIVHDDQRRVIRIKNADGVVSFERDLANRIVRSEDTNGYEVRYRFSPGSHLERVSFPASDGWLETIHDSLLGSRGVQVSYDYDENGLVKAVSLTDKNHRSAEFNRDADGRITQLTSGQIKVQREYAGGFLPSKIHVVTADGSTVYEANYQYDKSGRCIKESGSNGDSTYTYDEAGRLQKVRYKEYTEIYNYDSSGNRLNLYIEGSEVVRRMLKEPFYSYIYHDERTDRFNRLSSESRS
jgi:RHS repeat-associated protein